MLNRMYGISALERSWLPKAGAFVLLCSSGLSPADAQQAPRRLSSQVARAIATTEEADAPELMPLPTLNQEATPTTRPYSGGVRAPINPNGGWTAEGRWVPVRRAQTVRVEPQVKRLPPVEEEIAPSVAASVAMDAFATPQTQYVPQASTPIEPMYAPEPQVQRLPPVEEEPQVQRLPPVEEPQVYGLPAMEEDLQVYRLPPVEEEPQVKRLPPVEETAEVSAYTPAQYSSVPSYTPPVNATPEYQPPSYETSTYTPPQHEDPLYDEAPIYAPVKSYSSSPETPPVYDPPTESGPSYSSESSSEGPLLTMPVENTGTEYAPTPVGARSTDSPYASHPVMPQAPKSYQAAAPPTRTLQQDRELQAVSARADVLVRRGFTTAGRGAIYSARADFTESLSMIAQAVDRQQKTDRHALALARGLRAINEAEQFQPLGSELGADIDVASLVTAHRTDILKGEISEEGTIEISLNEARDRYHAYAAEQLAIASANAPVASLALYGLGKARASQATERPTLQKIHFPAAMALYQASVQVDGQNFRAANELGVLAARLGRYEQALASLQQSVATAPTKESWRNLAIVHEQLGEQQLAQQALAEASQARTMNAPVGAHPALASSNVRWVSPQAFAQTGVPNITAQSVPERSAAAPAPQKAKSSLTDWLPWTKK